MGFEREQYTATIPLIPLRPTELDDWMDTVPGRHHRWLQDTDFDAQPGQWRALPGTEGHVEAVVFGMAEEGWLYQLAQLPWVLPKGCYRLESDWSKDARIQAGLGWGLASYRFARYKKPSQQPSRLLLEADIADRVEQLTNAQALVRDLVNTPTEDMGPQELAAAALAVGDAHGAQSQVIIGNDLLTENYPAVHAVGRAADEAPRLIRLSWGDPSAPVLALVGKGVCFDSGGLDIKSAAGMKLMKKDMGGAAHALALAQLVMQADLPVRLEVLIPAVENAISGNAYRPGDILNTRQGLSVEIGNTDAEGRLILADALTRACEDKPDLVIDFATLTGAARVALGPDLPPIFSNKSDVAAGLVAAGEIVEDPLWQLPLYSPYIAMIKSEIADLNNIGNSGFAGCITAALFLQHFVSDATPWVHIDTFAWNPTARPGRPLGGEALGLRAVFEFLSSRYS